MSAKGQLTHVGIKRENVFGTPTVIDTGDATAGSTVTKLEDTTKAWAVDSLIGYYVRITAGTGIGQLRKITDNDATTCTVATWTAPDATSDYEISLDALFGVADYLKFNSESISPAIEEIVSAQLDGRRDEPPSYKGLITLAGDTVHEVHPNCLGHLLRSWFGAPTTTQPSLKISDTTASATDTTIVGVTAGWTINEYTGFYVKITGGTGSATAAIGQVRVIVSNTIDTLTVAAWSATPDATSTFEIYQYPVYLHKFTPTNTPFSAKCDPYPYTLELEKDIGAGKAFRVKGSCVNSLAFSYGVGAKILALTASWLAKTYAQITKTTASLETTEPWRWNQTVLGIGLHDTGTATAGAATSITDAGATWIITGTGLIGYYVRITGGLGEGQIRAITANTATALTVATWGTTPDNTSTYEIYAFNKEIDTLAMTLENGLVAKPVLDGTYFIDRIIGDAFRSGTIAPTFKLDNTTQFDLFTGWTSAVWRVSFIGAVIATGGKWNYELTFEFPKVLYTAFPIAIGGPGEIMAGASGKLKYDATAAHMCRVYLTNGKSDY